MTKYVDEETRQRLITLTERTHNEALACRDAGAYRAACVMIGSAIEAVLLTTVVTIEDRLRESGLAPDDDPLRWSLGTLLKIARQADLLPGSTLSAAVEDVKRLRNLVHPGAYVREMQADFEVDDTHFQAAFRVLDEVYEVTLAALKNLRDSA
ncbi:MAG: hypothetical protein ABSC51_06400 [Gaiellaceae bacterium]